MNLHGLKAKGSKGYIGGKAEGSSSGLYEVKSLPSSEGWRLRYWEEMIQKQTGMC